MHALHKIFIFFGRTRQMPRESASATPNLQFDLRQFFKGLIALAMLTGMGVAQAANAFIVSDFDGNLLKVDSTSGATTVIGTTGSAGPMTDLAFNASGALWGITFTAVYKINPDTAALTLVGNHGVFGANALAFSSNGTLYLASSNSTSLYTVNTSSGVATALPGSMGTSSGGDLAFNAGQLYLAGANGQLVRINLGTTVAGTNVGAFGVADVYGLTTDSLGRLIAAAGRSFYQANTSTGALTRLFSYTGFGIVLGTAQLQSINMVPINFILL